MRTYYDAVMSGRPILASGIQTLRDYVQDDLNQAGITFQWTWTTVSCGSPRSLSHLGRFSPETLSRAIARVIEPDRHGR